MLACALAGAGDEIELLLLGLGGVLIELSGVAKWLEWTSAGPEQARRLWPRLFADPVLADAFDARFASHELGLLEPDAVAFEEVTRRLGCPAERVLFLDDDDELNVEGARSAGLRAERAVGVGGVRAVLRKLDLRAALAHAPPPGCYVAGRRIEELAWTHRCSRDRGGRAAPPASAPSSTWTRR